MKTLVLASRNRDKLAELRRILAAAHVGVELVGTDAYPDLYDIPEIGMTFAENAVLKARSVAAVTGLPAVADDSGLCVDVLGGMPGIFSARWSGQRGPGADKANVRLLLAQLADVADEHRSAHFVCAAALVTPGGVEHVVEGRLDGMLIREARGTAGFGYDPIFVPDGETRTLAELPPGAKDAISHRGRALRGLTSKIAEMLDNECARRDSNPHARRH